MSTLDNLKLSTMVEDTKLAEEYLKKINYEIRPSQCFSQNKTGDYEMDSKNNKIYLLDADSSLFDHDINNPTTYKSLASLADKLEENSELLAQLDYLIRNRAKDDTKKYDLRLIVNYLRSFRNAPELRIPYKRTIKDRNFNKNTSMACLLSVVHSLQAGEVVLLNPNIEVAVIAELFTNLCQSVGLPVFFGSDGLNIEDDFGFVNDPSCAGVITEYSDRESAIDALIPSTSTHCPWKLRRLLIQESCYEECKGIFCRKTKGVIMTSEKCTARLEIGGKQFVFDYVGMPKDVTAEMVLVEPYRTSKELLSLLTKYQPLFATVWSSYLSEANEIAYQSKVPHVWINETCNFDHNNSLVQSIQQSLLCRSQSIYITDAIKLKSDNWLKLDFQQRKNILKLAFPEDNQDILKEIDRCEINQEVEVTYNRIYVGLTKPAKYIRVNFNEDVDLLLFIRLIMDGTTFISEGNFIDSIFIRKMDLKTKDLPIVDMCLERLGSKQNVRHFDNVYVTEKKWVITSYGTKFAN